MKLKNIISLHTQIGKRQKVIQDKVHTNITTSKVDHIIANLCSFDDVEKNQSSKMGDASIRQNRQMHSAQALLRNGTG